MQGSGLGMCEEVREVGEFYQFWLGIAVYHGAPASLVPPWEESIQSISPIWRGQSSLQSEVSPSLSGHPAPPFLFRRSRVAFVLQNQPGQTGVGGGCTLSCLQNRDFSFAIRGFGCKETQLCRQLFLLCPGNLPKFNSTLSSS